MISIRKCAKCGHEITEASVASCPMCGARLISLPGKKIWLGAAFQITVVTTFMLLFRFPKFMILIFVAMILAATVLSAWLKPAAAAARRPAPRRPLARPALFRILAFASLFCALAFVSFLLFGLVTFMNSWNTWHLYEGQSHHRSDFEVVQVYFQRGSKGAVDAYAKGTVEGQREWMDLRPYLESVPRSQAELESEVPAGTSIDVYLYPGLKGRWRIVVYDEVLPDAAARRTAMNALRYAPIGLAVSAGMLFLLSRLRRLCYVASDPSLNAQYNLQTQ